MRNKVFRTVRTGAPLLLVVAACMFAAGCDSMFVGDWDPCGPAPCAKPCAPCAPCAPAPCAQSGNCGPFPPEAKPGEAWCCVFVPPVYDTVKEKVCTCPESCRKEWVPPVTEQRKKQVCVKEACSHEVCEPAQYDTQTECVEVCPARTEWQRVCCSPEQLAAGEQQGDCWALVTIPAQYEQRCKQVCVKEATSHTETTPPVYETVEECVEVSCGYWKDIPVPAQYEEREKQVCKSDGRWEWRRNTHCEIPKPVDCSPCRPPAPGAMPPAPATPPAPQPQK